MPCSSSNSSFLHRKVAIVRSHRPLAVIAIHETDLDIHEAGGRTAWSSTVEVQGITIPARFWYDGQYIHNAKEDAAEVALQRIESGFFTQTSGGSWQNYHHNHTGSGTSSG